MRLTLLLSHFSSLKGGHILSSFLHDLYRDLFLMYTEKKNKTKEKISKKKDEFPQSLVSLLDMAGTLAH